MRSVLIYLSLLTNAAMRGLAVAEVGPGKTSIKQYGNFISLQLWQITDSIMRVSVINIYRY